MNSGHFTSRPASHPGLGAAYTSDDLAPEERLEHFDQLQLNSEHPMHVTSASPRAFRACARTLDLGTVDLVDLHCTPSRVVRTARLVRQLDPELVAVVVVRTGRVTVAQSGRVASLVAGDLALYSSSRPFHIDIASDSGTTRLVRAHLPRSLLSHLVNDLDGALATQLPGRHGVGALLSQFLTSLTEDADEFAPADLPRLGNLVVDLLAATISHHDRDPQRSAGAASAMLPRIMASVRHQLQDPHLSPKSIAAAHHISVSYLHRVFEKHDMTLSAWIRQERLTRARRDLTDPSLSHLPVHRIAARWGYQDHAAFTRAFRATFGMPPRDLRARIL